MEARSNEAATPKRVNGLLIAGAIAVVLAAFVLVFAITVGTSTAPTSVGGEVVPVAVQDVADADAGASTQVVAAGSAVAPSADATTKAGGEAIADEATPLAAYPGVQSNPLEGFTWLLLAGIVGAAVFFLLATRRMNKDITRMRSSIR